MKPEDILPFELACHSFDDSLAWYKKQFDNCRQDWAHKKMNEKIEIESINDSIDIEHLAKKEYDSGEIEHEYTINGTFAVPQNTGIPKNEILNALIKLLESYKEQINV